MESDDGVYRVEMQDKKVNSSLNEMDRQCTPHTFCGCIGASIRIRNHQHIHVTVQTQDAPPPAPPLPPALAVGILQPLGAPPL